jgi:hypothetical protein
MTVKRALPWLGVAAILAAFLAHLAWIHPVNYFGRYHDDTVYFSSAQALAGGRGYILPSLPGSPSQTKYPVLYPWLLSLILRRHAEFPANVADAIHLTAAFACGALVAAFLLLRTFKGVSGRLALLSVGLCAFHPFFLCLSGAVLTDVPFMALALAAALAADRSLVGRHRPWLPAAAGMLAGLSMLMRSVGAAVIAGIVAAALYRRSYRRAALFSLAAMPFAAVNLLAHAAPGAQVETMLPGWRQTWLYYTSYGRFWKLSVPDGNVLWSMISANLSDFLQAPASMCLFPPLGGESCYPGVLFSITLTAGIWSGVARLAAEPPAEKAGKPSTSFSCVTCR